MATLRIDWRASDPDSVMAMLERLGLSLSEGSVWLGPVILVVIAVKGEGQDRLEVVAPGPEPTFGPGPDATLPSDPRPNGSKTNGPRLAALGWATVDAQRLAAALGKTLSDEAHEDPALGATGYRVASASLPLVLLEPASEGRIAAALARLGEGPVALYLDGIAAGDEETTPRRMTATGRSGRLLRPTWPSGPYVVLLRELEATG